VPPPGPITGIVLSAFVVVNVMVLAWDVHVSMGFIYKSSFSGCGLIGAGDPVGGMLHEFRKGVHGMGY
jgi:hypothetical protein